MAGGANSPVYIDDVTDFMKGKEGDSNWKHHCLPRDRCSSEPASYSGCFTDKKVRILEIAQRADINDDGEGEPHLGPASLASLNSLREAEVYRAESEKEANKSRFSPGIKEEARGDEDKVFESAWDEKVSPENDGEKVEEK